LLFSGNFFWEKWQFSGNFFLYLNANFPEGQLRTICQGLMIMCATWSCRLLHLTRSHRHAHIQVRDVTFGIQIGSDWPQMGQIWDFLRSVSVHFVSPDSDSPDSDSCTSYLFFLFQMYIEYLKIHIYTNFIKKKKNVFISKCTIFLN